jgi:PAS domain S-box-containing protein
MAMAKELVGTVTVTDNTRDSKSPSALRNPHVWYVTAIMIVCSILYYLNVILDLVGLPNPGWSVFLGTHDLHLFLFSIPLLYAAYVFRVQGILIAGLILILIFIPRAIFATPYLEPFFRALLFTVFIAVLGILIAYVQNRRSQIAEAYTIVKQREEKLMIAETAIRTCVSAIATANLNGDLTYVNPAFLNIWGYGNPEQVLGKNFTHLCKEEKKVQGLIQTLLTKRDTEAVELVGKKKDGTELIIGLRASITMDAEGRPIGITASMADITERKKRED